MLVPLAEIRSRPITLNLVIRWIVPKYDVPATKIVDNKLSHDSKEIQYLRELIHPK